MKIFKQTSRDLGPVYTDAELHNQYIDYLIEDYWLREDEHGNFVTIDDFDDFDLFCLQWLELLKEKVE